MRPSEQSGRFGGSAERQTWIDLHGTDGMRYALPYRELRSIEMPSSRTISLRFVDRRVIVQGRNLGPVYDDLIKERVARLQEDDMDWASESETFISRLTIERSSE